MGYRMRGSIAAIAAGAFALAAAMPASAYLFWQQPKLQGQPVNGDEPGISPPLPGALPLEIKANLLWSMRAGLNVAALQCQFAPSLRTVDNYNHMLGQHKLELQKAYTTLSAYFKRTGGKTWSTKLDQYTTRTYNGFSTLHAQLTFCETAAQIGYEAQATPMGKLTALATNRMREFRNSLIPIADAGLYMRSSPIADAGLPALTCTDRKGREIACKQ
ncbi:hypothetical protein FHS31_002006 [Sphingomonas vulcanisoli]|uniref:DUF922 domain-containing protein n=1 Tax=Sphingomonas vulcanisoli TaxID=1658060 RepID=A0ABX0TW44_9SPHN|nr:hypothetical protein [Sphingomonas vulcanisoli]NIJ08389.1 hypothetical protein [Sphingomonas vulcanisoli]